MAGTNQIENLLQNWLKKYFVFFSTDFKTPQLKTHALRVARILYKPYQILIFMPFLAVNTFIMGTLAYISALWISPRFASTVFGMLWARLNSFTTPMFVKIQGREFIEKRQSYVIVSNHQSFYDIFILYGWIEIDFKWVMKTSLRKVPFLGSACEKIEHIYIDRSNPAAAIESINRAKEKIVNGTSVVFFPEGTRSATGKIGSFKKGAFIFALDMDLPILPITIIGTKNILPAKTLDLFPGKAEMIIHPPVRIENYKNKDIQCLMDDIQKVIQSAIPSGYA
ncbi:MAG: 1-acyl-sn-glycerol-3-phosphate acyltransferase [Desulfobacterium sp.]|nr:1-acyl-sn-glycerol-3-phosphate acyltransferase [Desulfobacterium sp.]